MSYHYDEEGAEFHEVIRVRGTSKQDWSGAARVAASRAYELAEKRGLRAFHLKVVSLEAEISPNPGGVRIFTLEADVTAGPGG